MDKQNKYKFKIRDAAFDTAQVDVYITYNAERNKLDVDVTSNLGKVKQSTKKWLDESSYGMCTLYLEDLDSLRELADAIRDKEWLLRSDGGETPFEDESMKQTVLKQLHDACEELPKFIAEKLKEGGFEDITDSEGWIDIKKFAARIHKRHKVSLSRVLLLDLPHVDSRFLIRDYEEIMEMLRDFELIKLWDARPAFRLQED